MPGLRTNYTDSDWLIYTQAQIDARRMAYTSRELIVNKTTGVVRQGPGATFEDCALVGTLGGAPLLSGSGPMKGLYTYDGSTDNNGDLIMDLTEAITPAPESVVLISAVSTEANVPLIPSLVDTTLASYTIRFTDPDNGVPAESSVRETIAYA